MAESAIAVDVPEADEHVSSIRERFDSSARAGAPAHITLLYPFAAPTQIGPSTVALLSNAIATIPSFAFRLSSIRRFTDTLYLAPEPAEPFLALTHLIVERFPRYLPYGGRYASVVPHLTVARGSGHDLDFAERSLCATLTTHGIRADCREVVLIENASGRWQRMYSFRLGSGRDLPG